MKVVLIDNEYLGLDLLENILKKLDFPEIWISGKFNSPIEAIPFILENKPDLIIMDLETATISGLEMIRLFSFSKCFFIIISTLDSRILFKEHSNSKSIFLDKPFTTNDMKQAILDIEMKIKK